MNTCYDCGKPLTPEEEKRNGEHVPAQNHSADYEPEYKIQRIKVPSCFDCNNKASKHEDELRNWIGVKNNGDQPNEISAKTARGVIRKNPSLDRLQFNDKGQVEAVKFNPEDIIKTHVKNFKGLFYYKYKKTLNPRGAEKYTIEVHLIENGGEDFMKMATSYLLRNFEWQVSGHAKVFQYILQPYRDKLNESDKPDVKVDDLETEPMYLAIMEYNESHVAVVSAANKEFLQKQKERLGK
ncbi:MAG TPA: hypothetical protein VK177_17930 [Flavobacteriales bacterium]|nr:hypothetical protein [Flavobacteriales bacterium]